MLNNDSHSPLDRLWRAALLILAIVVALWVAVHLLMQVWGWLLAIVIILGVVWALVLWVRRRRNRW